MGYKKEEVINKKASEILKIPEHSRNEIARSFIQQNHIKNSLTSFLDKNNKELKVELTATLIESDSEKKIYASAKDITALYNQEVLLKKLSIFAEHSSNSAILTDSKGRIQWINQGFINTKGYTFHEVKNNSTANSSGILKPPK